MDIKKLKAFSVVAEFGSFSRAAAVLGVVQPMLSRQVRSLEEELGVQLVHRNGRGSKPSAALRNDRSGNQSSQYK